MSLTLDLNSRVALVTGGTRGIGAGIAAVLAQAGATVLTCARSEAGTPGHYVCDVRDPDAVVAMFDTISREHGRLDVLVNNAGGAPYSPAADASPRLHDKVLALNLNAPLLLAQQAYRLMAASEQGGSIINISSVSALRPSPGTAAYGAAKAGIDSLTRTLAVEWGPKVRVNSIDVGLCRTEQTADHYVDDDVVAQIEDTIPAGRMATPEEVGNVVAFLASDLASYVSGASIACHGGGEPPVFLHVVNQHQGAHS